MKFNVYQLMCIDTAKYPDMGNNFIYPTLGLAGESGEVAEKVKKIIRDHNGQINEERRVELSYEIVSGI